MKQTCEKVNKVLAKYSNADPLSAVEHQSIFKRGFPLRCKKAKSTCPKVQHSQS